MKLVSLFLTFFALVSMSSGEVKAAEEKCRGKECRGGNGRVERPRANRPRPNVNRPRSNRPRPNVNRPRANRPRPNVNRPRPNRPRPTVSRPRPNGPRHDYRTGPRRDRSDYRRLQHRPLWWLASTTFSSYTHVPYRRAVNHHNRWSRSMSYHYTLPYSNIYWDRWVRVRHQRNNGYFNYNNYPYFVYNGYRHRYSRTDNCNYELVDGYNNDTERNFSTYSCSTGYDLCADVRDQMNRYESGYRYFCSEKFNKDSNYNYNWNYSDDFWSDANESTDYDDYDDYDYDDSYDWDYN